MTLGGVGDIGGVLVTLVGVGGVLVTYWWGVGDIGGCW